MNRSFRMAAAVLMLGALSGCERIEACLQTEQKVTAPSAAAPAPMPLMSAWSNLDHSVTCPAMPAANTAPAEYERGQFDERTRTGQFTQAIAIGCILYNYSPAQLDQWAGKGDPVARLATVLLLDQREGFVCSNAAGTKQLLLAAAAVPAAPGSKISRVPEIYDIIDDIDLRCGTPIDPANRKMAEASGYFTDKLSVAREH